MVYDGLTVIFPNKEKCHIRSKKYANIVTTKNDSKKTGGDNEIFTKPYFITHELESLFGF
jgi:hypothetical protein